MFRTVFFAALLTIAISVGAKPPQVLGGYVIPDLSGVGRGSPIPNPELAVIEDISQERALARAAAAIWHFTSATNMEACARLEHNADSTRWRLVVKTNYAHVGCLVSKEPSLSGFVATNETIHSHPTTDEVRLNRVDVLYVYGQRGQLATVLPDDFSPRDVTNGPGYLVTKGRVLRQTGAGTVRDLGPVASLFQPAPALVATTL